MDGVICVVFVTCTLPSLHLDQCAAHTAKKRWLLIFNLAMVISVAAE